MKELNLVGLCGSLRTKSFNRKLLNEAVRVFGPSAYSEGNLRLPLYDGDLEDRDGIPGDVQTLANQIAAADAVIIAAPEYNKSITGVLKNALDWISRTDGNPWHGKPVALISAAGGREGGARSQFAVRLCLAPFRLNLIPGPEVLVAGPTKEFDADGHLNNDRYLKALEEQMRLLRDASSIGKGSDRAA
ncbi:NADPH-dependent FMN reductase [Qingshengfaniella alkalisoli]|uniref:NAD(P)H-dependent oxidoreductase n=1 Tax=Qingshengfaniella alkalisoli TaxID=2599296 RepID=A0A5B8IW65_9RHOB|nr:NADPH-dependent FMN reductase [Qingshengfaniella alkalisoli]QDY69894.1 NAD(P)H-dependent oxidoreductase [Qingshengfaniella alkalisoli]